MLENAVTQEFRRKELSRTLDIWRDAHARLVNQAATESGYASDRELQSGYQRLEPHFQAMNDAASALVKSHEGLIPRTALDSLLRHEPDFLNEMHSLVGLYERQSRGHVRQLQRMGLVIMIAILAALLLMQFGVMRPELNTVEREWEKNEAHYELLVESMTDGLVVIDRHGKVEFSNGRFGEMLGQSRDTLIGQPVLEFVAGIDHPPFQRLLATEENSPPVDLKLRRSDGVEIDTLISPRRMADGKGDFQNLLLVVTDTTARKSIEQRSQNLQTQLTHADRLKSMGTMVAALAHEINQPLGAISNYAEGCLTRLAGALTDPKELVAPLRSILQASVRGGEIVRRTRNFARRRPFQLASESINELIHEMEELCRPEARRRSVVIELHLGNDLPEVLVDGIQIQQVLINLIENAFHALDQVDPGQRKITLATCQRDEQTIEVSVKDSGPGVGLEKSQTLFEPFITTEVNGTGLGLTIARGIIDSHDGQIWNVPDVVSGAEFRFTLPIPTQAEKIQGFPRTPSADVPTCAGERSSHHDGTEDSFLLGICQNLNQGNLEDVHSSLRVKP